MFLPMILALALGGARDPISLDPIAASTWAGEATNNWYGFSVSDAGDVNGDGYADVIVGAFGYADDTGRAYLYLGSASGVATSPATTLTGEEPDSKFGTSVSSAGDVNGDGYGDVIVGAPVYGSGDFEDVGRAYVYLGSPGGLVTTAATTLTGAARNDGLGHSVAGAGDVNGDGYDDIVVGAPYGVSYQGKVYVHQGSAGGVSDTPALTLAGDVTFEVFGYAVSGAGDVNGDGYDDVIVGVFAHDGYKGRADVFQGSATGLSATAAIQLTGEAEYDLFGSAVTGAGDIDADGYDDLVVGAPNALSNTGRAYVYAGSSGGIASTVTLRLTGEAPDNAYGYALSSAGDLDDDGYADVIVGAHAYVGSAVGRAYLYVGAAAGLDATADTILTGDSVDDAYAYAVSGAGDVNGDGLDDVIVGAPYQASVVGRAYTYHGEADIPVDTGDTDVDTGGDTDVDTDDTDVDTDDTDVPVDTDDTDVPVDTDDTDDTDVPIDTDDTDVPDDTDADDTGTGSISGGCGCVTGGASGAGWLGLLAAFAVRRRRVLGAG